VNCTFCAECQLTSTALAKVQPLGLANGAIAAAQVLRTRPRQPGATQEDEALASAAPPSIRRHGRLPASASVTSGDPLAVEPR
jgi:hypothetical protein